MKIVKSLLIASILTLLFVPQVSAAPNSRFQINCKTSHVAQVDPIVAPGGPSAHQHEFFGNQTTAADSTYESMIAGATTCSTVNDTAGYWTPTVIAANGTVLRAKTILIYYRGEAGQVTQAFPADLRIVSDNFAVGPNPANLIVKFPECWDGVNLDSPDHRSHMAFDSHNVCPASHPVRVPEITEVFRYPVNISTGYVLSSGDFSTGHADFWNTWDQAALEALVDRCLNQPVTECGRID